MMIEPENICFPSIWQCKASHKIKHCHHTPKLHTVKIIRQNYTLSRSYAKITHCQGHMPKLHTVKIMRQNYTLSRSYAKITHCQGHTPKLHTVKVIRQNNTLSRSYAKITHCQGHMPKLHTVKIIRQNYTLSRSYAKITHCQGHMPKLHTVKVICQNYTLSRSYAKITQCKGHMTQICKYISYTCTRMAAFQGMHVLPTKHSYVWLPRKCDYWKDRQTHGRTDRRWTEWSICATMLRRWHKNDMRKNIYSKWKEKMKKVNQ